MDVIAHKVMDKIADYESDNNSGLYQDRGLESPLMRELSMLCLSNGILLDDLVDLAEGVRTDEFDSCVKQFIAPANSLLKLCSKKSVKGIKIYLLADDLLSLHFKLENFNIEKELSNTVETDSRDAVLKSFQLYEDRSGGHISVMTSTGNEGKITTHVNLSLRT